MLANEHRGFKIFLVLPQGIKFGGGSVTQNT